jgi:anthranilate phosphoribosyltransferase
MAATLAGMEAERAWVVHGAAGWDEATPIGPFLAFEVTGGEIYRHHVDPREFGLAPCESADLAGGDAATNLAALNDVFEGRDRGPHRAALVLQCGLALHIAGRASSIPVGIDIAGSALDSGQALRWLRQLENYAAELHPT